MRVLAYSDSLTMGGAEIALGYLLGALGREIDVGVLALDRAIGETIAAQRPGTPLAVVSPPRNLHDRDALAAHRRAIRAFEPDVLHVNHAWPWAGAYAEAGGLLVPGVRVVAVDHLPVAGPLPRRQLLPRRALARRAHAHIAVGERVARMIEELVSLERGSAIAVANGVPVDRRGAPRPPRHGSAPVIGSTGRLTDQKGFDALVEALPAFPDARLVLVGDGPERPALERRATDLGVSERVSITGWQPDPRAYLCTFDVFALPSRWEGMPLVILEAMHAGLPVIASDVGSVSEAVVDRHTGYVVAPGDTSALHECLSRLLSDPSLRRQFGAAGRARAAQRFTVAAMALGYEAAYASLFTG